MAGKKRRGSVPHLNLGALNSRPSFIRALRALHGQGCDPNLLSFLFSKYTDPRPSGLELADQLSGYSPKTIARIQQKLDDVAAAITRLNEFELPGKFSFLGLLEKYGPRQPLSEDGNPSVVVEHFRTLPVLMREYAQNLTDWPHPVFRELISDRRLGQEFWLVMASIYVEHKTGQKHYTLLADIAEGYLAAYGTDKTVDPENLRKAIANFKERNPELVRVLEETSFIEGLAAASQAPSFGTKK